MCQVHLMWLYSPIYVSAEESGCLSLCRWGQWTSNSTFWSACIQHKWASRDLRPKLSWALKSLTLLLLTTALTIIARKRRTKTRIKTRAGPLSILVPTGLPQTASVGPLPRGTSRMNIPSACLSGTTAEECHR